MAGHQDLKFMSNDTSALWASLFKQYRNADDVTSLLLVKCTEGSNAEVCFYVKTGEKNAWVPKGQGNAFIGKNGLGKEREGDARTPEGEFSATMAFGILPDPGTRYDYIDILPETYAARMLPKLPVGTVMCVGTNRSNSCCCSRGL